MGACDFRFYPRVSLRHGSSSEGGGPVSVWGSDPTLFVRALFFLFPPLLVLLYLSDGFAHPHGLRGSPFTTHLPLFLTNNFGFFPPPLLSATCYPPCILYNPLQPHRIVSHLFSPEQPSFLSPPHRPIPFPVFGDARFCNPYLLVFLSFCPVTHPVVASSRSFSLWILLPF